MLLRVRENAFAIVADARMCVDRVEAAAGQHVREVCSTGSTIMSFIKPRGAVIVGVADYTGARISQT